MDTGTAHDHRSTGDSTQKKKRKRRKKHKEQNITISVQDKENKGQQNQKRKTKKVNDHKAYGNSVFLSKDLLRKQFPHCFHYAPYNLILLLTSIQICQVSLA